MPLIEVAPKVITLEMYLLLTAFEKSVVPDQLEMIQVVDKALEISIDKLLIEN